MTNSKTFCGHKISRNLSKTTKTQKFLLLFSLFANVATNIKSLQRSGSETKMQGVSFNGQ